MPRPPGYDPLKDKIEIVDYDPIWPGLFRQEAEAIREKLAPIPGLILEHCGSTAVPGLAAKPVIDILLAVQSPSDWPRLIQPLSALGYYYWPDAFEGPHWFFVKGIPPLGQGRTHQIHVLESQGPEWKDTLAFRDYLRAHAETAEAYGILKRRLAKEFETNRLNYMEAKTDFIQLVLHKRGTE